MGIGSGRRYLFLLGIVMYESLAGRLPFAADTTTAAVDRLVHAEPPPLTRLNDDIPPSLEEPLRKLLPKRADNRYQTERGCSSV
ncbi:MAG: hypothetical protein VYE68_02210 [Acidobacteriota bacterium]|nr:hypothetical protein [Acidobacteriota bacterium]